MEEEGQEGQCHAPSMEAALSPLPRGGGQGVGRGIGCPLYQGPRKGDQGNLHGMSMVEITEIFHEGEWTEG